MTHELQASSLAAAIQQPPQHQQQPVYVVAPAAATAAAVAMTSSAGAAAAAAAAAPQQQQQQVRDRFPVYDVYSPGFLRNIPTPSKVMPNADNRSSCNYFFYFNLIFSSEHLRVLFAYCSRVGTTRNWHCKWALCKIVLESIHTTTVIQSCSFC